MNDKGTERMVEAIARSIRDGLLELGAAIDSADPASELTDIAEALDGVASATDRVAEALEHIATALETRTT